MVAIPWPPLPLPCDFDERRLPDEIVWRGALRNQMAEVPARDVALADVRQTVAKLARWTAGAGGCYEADTDDADERRR